MEQQPGPEEDEAEDYNALAPQHLFHFKYHRELATFSDPVGCIAFTQDGKTLLTGMCSGDIKLWDSHAWAEVAMLQGVRKEEITCLLMSPGQKWLASVQATAILVFRFEAPYNVEHTMACREFAPKDMFRHDMRWVTASFFSNGRRG